MDSLDATNYKIQGHSTEFERTLTGLLLMAIGTATLWVPYLMYLGELLNFIGIIFIFLGRRAFEPSHSTFVVLSIVFYFAATVALTVIVLSFALNFVSIYQNGASQSVQLAQLKSAVLMMLETVIAVNFLVALSFVLFSWKINDSTGHTLLIIGYVVSVIIPIIGAFFVLNFVDSALASLINGTPAQTVLSQINARKSLYSLPNAISYLIFAFTYFRTRSVIQKRPSDPSVPKIEPSF